MDSDKPSTERETVVEMTTKHGEPNKLIRFEDMTMLNHFSVSCEEQMKFVKDLPYMNGDILLCTYPKCGTHWMGALIRGLVKKSPDEPDRPRFGLLEFLSSKDISDLDAPRIFTTHLKPDRLPTSFIENKCKIVLVLRNPKDAAVSLYHHLKTSTVVSNPQDWNEYFESFKAGNVPWGSFFDYTKGWESVIKQSEAGENNFNVECFYYEDLKKNMLENLRRLNRHVGHPRSDKELMEVADGCSFKNLSERMNADKEKVPRQLRRKDGTSVIFRKGDVGDWKNLFTVTQNEVFDRLIESRLAGSMFTFKFE